MVNKTGVTHYGRVLYVLYIIMGV